MKSVKQESLAARFAKGRVLVLGDIMLDVYLYGNAERISPEAPVPIVHVQEDRHLLGGAANVARNIVSLGGHATLVGLVGDDAHGQAVVAMLQKSGIEANLCKVSGRCTTVKTRVIAQRQQMLRLDYENVDNLEPENMSALLARLTPLLDTHDVLIISDYAKGLISYDFMYGLRKILAERPNMPWLVDPKPQHMPLFAGATIVTPNAKETAEAANIVLRSREDILRAGDFLRTQVPVEHVLATLGADGMALFMPDATVWHIPTVAQEVFDVTGAGDTVVATLGLALASGFSVREACVLANAAAGYAVSQLGAAALDVECLQASCTHSDTAAVTRWA